MSDPEDGAENFLQRWSRRKQAAATRSGTGSGCPESTNTEARSSPASAARNTSDLPAFDPATLPPIESITATSDIRAFLAPGVPEALSRAALRRAWATDPKIRDFVGLAENQWDFNKPDAVPGFGSLKLTPELGRMLARLVGEPTQQPPAVAGVITKASERLPPPAARPAVGATNVAPKRSAPPLVLGSNNNTQTVCEDTATACERPRRRHGAALPK
jgi:Protein of unknown function (DUF3306)